MGPDAPPLRQRAIRALLIAVVLQALFVFFFLFPAHDPEPNGFPVAVVGPAQAVERFGAALRERGEFDVQQASSPAAARELVADRDVYGAFVLGGGGVEQVLKASAASLPASQVVETIGRSAGARAVEDVRPLVREDARGVTLNLLVLPLIVTSILASVVGLQLAPELDLRGRVGVVALAGVFGGLIAVAIANWWLDALPGPWLAEAGVIALAVIGLASIAAALIRLLGPPGVAAAFLLFLMVGNPASGVASAPELLPTPWNPVGQLLPPGALGSALRGTAYFDGAGVVFPLGVLLAWAVAGAALLAFSVRRPPAVAGG